MQPMIFEWLGVAVGSLVAGAALAGMLVVRRTAEPIVLLAGLAGATANGVGFVLLADGARPNLLLWAIGIMLAAAGGGYALVSSVLDNLSSTTPLPPLPEPAMPDTGPAAILFCCAEPPAYDPRATAQMLDALVEEDLIELSIGTTPFLYLSQKARYRAVGGASPSLAELTALAESLEDATRDTFSRFTWATCDGEHSLARRVSALATAGHRRIVVVELAVAQTIGMSEAKRAVDALRPAAAGIEIDYTGPLAGAERIATLVASRITALAEDPSATGAVLVGHAQPDDRARANPDFDEREIAFLNRVRLKVSEHSIPEGNIRIAWANWREPDITSAVRHLAALGCRRVIVCPATFPLDTIETRLDMEIAVRQARVADSVTAVTLPAWKEDLMLTEELRVRALSALAGED